MEVKICGQEINAMLDCGAMVNAIDVKTLRRIMPNIHLHHFSRRLIGADRGLFPSSAPQIFQLNLNTELIIGVPGLKHLHIAADFDKSEVRINDTVVARISIWGITFTTAFPRSRRTRLKRLFAKWKNTLVESIQDRGPAKGYTFSINTGNTKPIYVPLRTYSPKEQAELDKQIEEMLEKHIITHTRSPWSAPVLLVKKKDNTYRVVVDYTRLNAKSPKILTQAENDLPQVVFICVTNRFEQFQNSFIVKVCIAKRASSLIATIALSNAAPETKQCLLFFHHVLPKTSFLPLH